LEAELEISETTWGNSMLDLRSSKVTKTPTVVIASRMAKQSKAKGTNFCVCDSWIAASLRSSQ
jgi:hypothetical protein